MKNPRYNIGTKRISGCKKDSFAYYHEYRHKLQHNRDLFSKFFMVVRYPYVIIGGYYWGKYGMNVYTIMLLLPFLFMMYLELDAHLYALNNIMEKPKR